MTDENNINLENVDHENFVWLMNYLYKSGVLFVMQYYFTLRKQSVKKETSGKEDKMINSIKSNSAVGASHDRDIVIMRS